jgi:hypothetical protein
LVGSDDVGREAVVLDDDVKSMAKCPTFIDQGTQQCGSKVGQRESIVHRHKPAIPLQAWSQ